MPWWCRLFHWRKWYDDSSGTIQTVKTLGKTIIRCRICRRAIMLPIVRAGKPSMV